MGLFDGGLGVVISGVFGALYPDAILHRAIRTETTGGSKTATFTGLDSAIPGTMVKATKQAASWRMQQVEGYAVGDVQFVILTTYDDIGLPEPLNGDRMTWPATAGRLYTILEPIALDAAASHWIARGRLA